MNPSSILPPFLSADYCLRCSRNYDHREATVLVRGGPGARQNQIGIFICHGCLLKEGGMDIACAEGMYDLHKRGVSGIDWPEYVNATSKKIWGFICAHKLDNGVYRVGLKEHHVEIWSRHDVETIGAAMSPRQWGYIDDNYVIVARPIEDPERKIILIEDVRFYDLAKPGMYFTPPMFRPEGTPQ